MKKKLSIIVIITFMVVASFFMWKFSQKEEKEEKEKIESGTIIDNSNNQYGVSTSNPLATQVGMDILNEGGNAIDAAIAVAYTLGVVEPYGSGVGGGGGMLIKFPDKQEPIFVDYKEISDGQEKNENNSTGIPGFVAGMDYLQKNYGTMDMETLMEPAIKYAEKGFKVNAYLASRINRNKNYIIHSAPHFYKDRDEVKENDTIIQEELGETLEAIQKKGANYFYDEILIERFNYDKKLMDKRLVVEREPAYGEIDGKQIYSAPPPFSGVTLIQIMKMIEHEEIRPLVGSDSENIKKYLHIVELAYNDRKSNIGDPSVQSIEYHALTTDEYVSQLLSKSVSVSEKDEEEPVSTTHFSIIDQDGLTVSATNTLGQFWGTGEAYKGFFLNNGLDNFNTVKGSFNEYLPYKKSRSFMAPTIIVEGDSSVMAIGTPGGNRIPQILAQVLLDYHFTGDLKESITVPRMTLHNKFINFESYPEKNLIDELRDAGYSSRVIDLEDHFGGINAIIDQGDKIIGISDFRRDKEISQ